MYKRGTNAAQRGWTKSKYARSHQSDLKNLLGELNNIKNDHAEYKWQ